jgi:hypothetical protein
MFVISFLDGRVKVKIKAKFTLEQATKAQMGWVVKVTPRPLYPQERDPVPNL